jgi:phospholipid/cholesterol/gamma-HCH transport system substrate-binding protein
MKVRLIAPLAVLMTALAAVVLVAELRSSRHVTLVFDEVLGLAEGAEVRVGGRPAGEVEEVSLGGSGLPHVRVVLHDDVLLHAGARATLTPYSAAAKELRYIALEPGAGPPLRDGAMLGRAATDGPVEADAALSTLGPTTRRDLRLLLDRTDATLRRRGPALDRTLARSARALDETAALVGAVTQDGVALRSLVRDGRRVTGALAEHRAALGGAVEGLGRTLGVTAGRQRELSATLAELPGTLRAARGALGSVDDASPELTRLARDARPGSRELLPTARALRPTLRAAGPALRESRRLVGAAPADLRPLDALLGEVRTVIAPTRSALARANPMLDELRVRTPEVGGFATNWADAASSFDANGHGLRTAQVFAEPPRRPVRPSQARPGRLVPPFTRTPGVLEGEPWRSYRESFVGGAR